MLEPFYQRLIFKIRSGACELAKFCDSGWTFENCWYRRNQLKKYDVSQVIN